MRLDERQGFASMPSRRRRRSVSCRSTTSKRSENLSQKLLAPLPAQRRRGEDEHAPDAAPEQQLGEDEPRFDGLAEAHVVGEWAGCRAACAAPSGAERAGSPRCIPRRGRGWPPAAGAAGRPGLLRRHCRRRRSRDRGRAPSSAPRGAARRSLPRAWRRRGRGPAARSAPAGGGRARAPTGGVLRRGRGRPGNSRWTRWRRPASPSKGSTPATTPRRLRTAASIPARGTEGCTEILMNCRVPCSRLEAGTRPDIPS